MQGVQSYLKLIMANDNQSQFIGRGEVLVQQILSRFYPHCDVTTQVPIGELISKLLSDEYGEEFTKHKVDIVADIVNAQAQKQTLVIEVNYKHKEKAAKKWRTTFAPDLTANDKTPVTIDDYDCREKGIFYLNTKKQHQLSWDDFRDVIDQLEKAGVQP